MGLITGSVINWVLHWDLWALELGKYYLTVQRRAKLINGDLVKTPSP